MVGSIFLIGCLLTGQADSTADDELVLTIRGLVRQLGAPELAEREAAERQLIELGPKVLDVLPQITPQTPPETRLRLGRIRQRLEQLAAESTARPSSVTLRGRSLPLSEILAVLHQQTGNRIVDFRRRFGHQVTDPVLDVDFDRTPFWHALDDVLDRAGLTVYPFGPERTIALVARDQTQLLRAARGVYSGPFRLEPVQIAAACDLRHPESRSLMLTVEVVCEPRIRPIGVQQRIADLSAVDENGDLLAFDDSWLQLELDPTKGVLRVPMKLPPRSVEKIARLRGRLTAMIPGRVETFCFDGLLDAANVEKRIGGTTVTLVRARRNNAVWEVGVRVRLDQPGAALESHRGWIYDNEAYLEDPDGKPIPYDSQDVTRQAENQFGINYIFVLDGPPERHAFVYKTPAAIVSTGFDYEIKDIALP